MVKAKARRSLVAVCVLLVLQGHTAPALAQERRTLLDLMFGDRRAQQPPPRRSIIDIQPPRQRNREPDAVTPLPRRLPTAPSAPVAAAPPIAADKMENARKILVIGDFTASGLATGLSAAFAEDPTVAILENGSGSSGLVRQDFYDWPRELRQLLDAEKPAMVVVMIGANDRQAMSIGDIREKFRTEAWLKEYEARVAQLALIVIERKLPLLWVGLPAFQSPSLTADAVTLNGIYRQTVEKTGGEFVDIWDGFVDEGGQFIVTGSDINGQQVRLRGADGLGFTEAGKRKLAFYVEKLARRYLGDLGISELIRLDAGNLPLLSSLPPEAEANVPSQPISLSDPELDGGKDLLGAAGPASIPTDTPRSLLLTKGAMAEAPIGRVDYYRADTTGATPQ
ncbi:DUF459 domain-containing protein [Rhizobium sp. FY34]|uniref:SGNH/GDSL hydrolase family protein n=1 Tax=Rhizobium sp. FY34 TaxID=2562309 RepID=UPI0010C0A8BF|nr:DUF459 domain-containing protein [Rhizobium sp. FY34]